MLFGGLCAVLLQTLVVSAGRGRVKMQMGVNGEFPLNRESDMVFKLPRYFTESTSRNERLIDFESMRYVVKSLIKHAGMRPQARGNKNQRELVLKHLHRAFCREKMTNIDVINMLSVIAHNHNFFARFDVNPGMRTPGCCRGLTQLCHVSWFVKLDDLSGRHEYYTMWPHKLDELSRDSILDEVRLYKSSFSRTNGGVYTSSIAQILRNYASNEAHYVSVEICGVTRENARIMPRDHLSKLTRRYYSHKISGKAAERAHRRM